MDLFLFLAKWAWVFMAIVNPLNYLIMRTRTQKLAGGDPERQKGYDRILRVFYTASAIPFVVMGIGILVGGVPTVFHFFRPQDGDPFVWAFFLSIFILWVLSFYWVFFRGGAQTLAEYPGAITRFENPVLIKLILLIGLAGGILAIFMMYRQDLPIDLIFNL